jgi:putative Holliday junction resolvase
MKLIGLDVGERRIGVAWANSEVRLAAARPTLINDEGIFERIRELVRDEKAEAVVVGLPRNSQGTETRQSEYTREFVRRLELAVPVYFQDESLTSVLAEGTLRRSRKGYQRGDVDAAAAVLILNDYLERNF